MLQRNHNTIFSDLLRGRYRRCMFSRSLRHGLISKSGRKIQWWTLIERWEKGWTDRVARTVVEGLLKFGGYLNIEIPKILIQFFFGECDLPSACWLDRRTVAIKLQCIFRIINLIGVFSTALYVDVLVYTLYLIYIYSIFLETCKHPKNLSHVFIWSHIHT